MSNKTKPDFFLSQKDFLGSMGHSPPYQKENEVILSLQEKQKPGMLDKIREFVCEEMGKEINPSLIARNLTIQNVLLPDVSLIQNIRILCELYNINMSQIRQDYNILHFFKENLHCRRGGMDEGLWQAFGLMFYLLASKDYLFVSMPTGLPMASNKKSDLMFIINEVKKLEKIYFYAHPPAIDAYKDICNIFRIYENDTIGLALNYEQAREHIIAYNNKSN